MSSTAVLSNMSSEVIESATPAFRQVMLRSKQLGGCSQLGPLLSNMLNIVTPLLKDIHCTHWGSGGGIFAGTEFSTAMVPKCSGSQQRQLGQGAHTYKQASPAAASLHPLVLSCAWSQSGSSSRRHPNQTHNWTSMV